MNKNDDKHYNTIQFTVLLDEFDKSRKPLRINEISMFFLKQEERM